MFLLDVTCSYMLHVLTYSYMLHVLRCYMMLRVLTYSYMLHVFTCYMMLHILSCNPLSENRRRCFSDVSSTFVLLILQPLVSADSNPPALSWLWAGTDESAEELTYSKCKHLYWCASGGSYIVARLVDDVVGDTLVLFICRMQHWRSDVLYRQSKGLCCC